MRRGQLKCVIGRLSCEPVPGHLLVSNHSCCIDSNVLFNHALIGGNGHGKGDGLIIRGVTELPNRSIFPIS